MSNNFVLNCLCWYFFIYIDPFEYGEWSIHYGYLDGKPLYSAKPANGEISIKVSITTSAINYILLCGAAKESLLHTTIFLDLNVPANKRNADYVPSTSRVEWTKHKVLGNECKYIEEIPKGDHVLTIVPNPTHPDHVTSLSHVIFWEMPSNI